MELTKTSGIVCPFCGSSDLDFPTDAVSGEQQHNLAYCYSCYAYQDADGDWVAPQNR